MKYSFIMPICFRNNQFYNTLLSFEHWYKDRTDYEIILVEDIKNSEGIDHKPLMKIISRFKKEGVDIRLAVNKKRTINPASHYNQGVRISKGEYIIVTNPECFHKTDILEGLDKHFEENPDYYIVCAAQSGIWNAGKFKKGRRMQSFEEEVDLINRLWFQHTVHRNENLHFCSAMSKKNYNFIEGFDEIFSDGYGVEDVDFEWKIKHTAKHMTILPDDDMVVYHQPHIAIKPADWLALNQKNKQLLIDKWGTFRAPVPPSKGD